MFAGKRRQSDVGTFLKKLEADGRITLELLEYDIERSETHDLRSKELWQEIFAISCKRVDGSSL